MARPVSFSQGIGKWIGSAEVYDGSGRFLGNAHDQRHVQRDVDERTVSIDLSFAGPFKFAGRYSIADHGDHRLYLGPANVGFAETLADNLIDAYAYWPITGLSQRFFLMVLPGPDGEPAVRQMSLALMARGEQLLYAVVGEYQRVGDDWQGGNPILLNGTSFDLADDPAAGRASVFLQRPGEWRGTLSVLDGALEPIATLPHQEIVQATAHGLRVTRIGNHFDPAPAVSDLRTNGRLAWSEPGDVVGSYSLYGGRALSGTFHHLAVNLHVQRREVVSHDGTHKAVVYTWYRGGERVGVVFGVMEYTG